jgi:hypothetical protein
MERAAHDQRLDGRSRAEQGREDLASLVEPKKFGSDGPEAIERHEEIAELRRQREQLPAWHLDQVATVEQIEREAEKAIAEVESKNRKENLYRSGHRVQGAKAGSRRFPVRAIRVFPLTNSSRYAVLTGASQR